MPEKIGKNRISIEKIKRYKELKVQAALIEKELEELKEYFNRRMTELSFDDIVVDQYRIQRQSYWKESLPGITLKVKEPHIYNKYAVKSLVERVVIK